MGSHSSFPDRKLRDEVQSHSRPEFAPTVRPNDAELASPDYTTHGIPVADEPSVRYEEIGECGRGGLGRVLLVHDRVLDRRVALKEQLEGDTVDTESPTLTTPSPSRASGRFVREARITAQLEHPSIVPLYEFGHRDDGRLYYTMRLVQGRTLDKAIEEAYGLSGRMGLLDRFLDVCQAIAYAHSRGVIHRDIKPSNIMLGRYGETLVIDWGIAKSMEPNDEPDTPEETPREQNDSTKFPDNKLTQEGWLLGTPYYASPEQALGQHDSVDARSDIYALGAVLYQVITGRRPYEGDTLDQVLAKLAHEEPKPIIELEPNAPSELVAVCERAMARDPEQRYPTAEALAEDIQRFQTGSLVAAYHYSRWDRTRRFLKRHRLALSVACFVLTLFIGSAIAFMAAILAEQDRTSQALYRTSISLAEDAFKDRRLEEARQALDEAPPDRRHWEWGLLANLATPTYATFRGHTSPIRDIAYDTEGRHIATADADGMVRILDVQPLNQIASTFVGSDGADSVRFVPGRPWVLVGDPQGNLHMWDWQKNELGAALALHLEPIVGLAVSADGTWAATSSYDGSAALVRVNTFEIECRLIGHTARVMDIVVSHDGNRLVTSSQDGTARVWDRNAGTEVLCYTEHTNAVAAADLSPDDRLVATASWDNTVRLWEAATGQTVAVLTGHTGYVKYVAFIEQGSKLVSCGEDRTIRVWDVATASTSYVLDGFTSVMDEEAVSPDERFIAIRSTPAELALVPLREPSVGLTLRGHTGTVNGIDFSPDGRYVCTVGGHWSESNDTRAIVWDASTGDVVTVFNNHEGPVNAVRYFPEGQRIATGGSDCVLRIWDPSTGQELSALRAHTEPIRSLAMNRDGTRIVTAGWDDRAIIWDMNTERALAELLHGDNIDGVALSPSGNQVVTCGRNGRAVVWDMTSYQRLHEIQADSGWVWCGAYSPSGKVLALGDANGGLTLWDTHAWRRVRALKGHTSRVCALAYSPDGQRLVSGGKDATIRVWNPATGRELLRLDEHRDRVKAATFSADGLRLATGGYDQTAIVWTATPWSRTGTYPSKSNNRPTAR